MVFYLEKKNLSSDTFVTIEAFLLLTWLSDVIWINVLAKSKQKAIRKIKNNEEKKKIQSGAKKCMDVQTSYLCLSTLNAHSNILL